MVFSKSTALVPRLILLLSANRIPKLSNKVLLFSCFLSDVRLSDFTCSSLAVSFQHSATSLPAWRNPSHSVSVLGVGRNTQCRWLLLSHPLPQLFRLPAPLFLTFTTRCWLLPKRSFPFPQFNSGLFTCSSTARFSSSRLLVNKAVRGVKHLIAR